MMYLADQGSTAAPAATECSHGWKPWLLLIVLSGAAPAAKESFTAPRLIQQKRKTTAFRLWLQYFAATRLSLVSKYVQTVFGEFAGDMMKLLICFAPLLLLNCANRDYRFERINGDSRVTLPFKLEGLYGARDGASVRAQARFVDGMDFVTMDINTYLRPPAEFQSGTYSASIGGRNITGAVECPSLAFQGGQTALPAIGGVFVLKDEQNRPIYRITIPARPLTSTKAQD